MGETGKEGKPVQPSPLGQLTFNAFRSSKRPLKFILEPCAQGTKEVIHQLLSITVHSSQVATHAGRACQQAQQVPSVSEDSQNRNPEIRRRHLVQIKMTHCQVACVSKLLETYGELASPIRDRSGRPVDRNWEWCTRVVLSTHCTPHDQVREKFRI